MRSIFQEFKPALFFLGKFLLAYFIGNLLYGFFIQAFTTTADPMTREVAYQTAWCLNASHIDATVDANTSVVAMLHKGAIVLDVFEGCNGLNVMIVFLAFVVAYKGPWKRTLWFVPLGIAIIHIMNIVRLFLLYRIALFEPNFFY